MLIGSKYDVGILITSVIPYVYVDYSIYIYKALSTYFIEQSTSTNLKTLI